MNIPVKHTLLSFVLAFSLFASSFAQGNSAKAPAKNWSQLDKAHDNYYGISLEKAYQLVKGKKSKQVIVAVLDNGIDTLHEDLKNILWHNPKEIPGNGVDDDHNGYVDDIYGWNFIGGKDGRNVEKDSDEGARTYHRLKAKYGPVVPDPATAKTPEEKTEIELYRKVKAKIEGEQISEVDLFLFKRIYTNMVKSDSILQEAMGKKIFTGKEADAYSPTRPDVVKAKTIFVGFLQSNNALSQTNKEYMEGFKEYLNGEQNKVDAKTKVPEDYRREIVKDNEFDINDRFYGNNDVMTAAPSHGTHTSGIIAASRNNGKGMDGIADNVKIMMVRMLADADEHDKDVALAIRYAVDNGAQIISMSFGKYFSPQKKWVDEAIQYAESKEVLLVHASGNDAKNIDSADHYPTPVFENGRGVANNFIDVGASSDEKIPEKYTNIKGDIASFSNYGKKSVDVFAPGVGIYSTVPGNDYTSYDGTSMAGPVVAGVAALLLEYYPNLSARQLKYVIEKSAVPLREKVKRPGSTEEVPLSDLSKTGGVVNAYEAMKLAATIKGERNNLPVITPKIIPGKKR